MPRKYNIFVAKGWQQATDDQTEELTEGESKWKTHRLRLCRDF